MNKPVYVGAINGKRVYRREGVDGLLYADGTPVKSGGGKSHSRLPSTKCDAVDAAPAAADDFDPSGPDFPDDLPDPEA